MNKYNMRMEQTA